MTDNPRSIIGLLGTLAAWLTVENGAVIAALVASLCTAAFMGLSALEKWESRKARLRAGRDTISPASPTP